MCFVVHGKTIFESPNNSRKLSVSDMNAYIEVKYDKASLFVDPDKLRLIACTYLSYGRSEEFSYTAGLSVSYKLGPRWDDVISWSDFKSEAIFGFLSPNYMGQCT